MMRRVLIVAVLLLALFQGQSPAGPTQDIRDAAIALRDSIAAAQADPVCPPCPPCPPPPTPEPDPEPDPTPDPAGPLGGDACSGFWDGWYADDATKFRTGPGYGIMLQNVNAATKMGLGLRGFVEFDAWHESDGCGGGQHLFYIASQTPPNIGPYDPALPNANGQYRIDFSVRTGKLYGVIYYDEDPTSGVDGTAVAMPNPTWSFLAYRAWAHVRVEWEQTTTQTKIRVNGQERVFPTPRAMNPLGNLLVVGNMDVNRDATRCANCGHNPCGSLGENRFRNFQRGRLP